mmetsp:Transcript_31268/g.110046  ORF Transcript_31268/g.110046 Transcript_31268/m.110046 type:complete len:444 (-) Transcript_31268:21-1352(-)
MWLLRGRTQRIFGRAQRCLVAAVALQVRALALTPGSRKGYFVEQSWTVPVLTGADEDGLLRLPEALQQLDAERWPSASRARKACRKGEILINGTVGRCINDVSAFDVVSRQLRFLPAYYPANDALKKPFDMEVVYEDQHLGVVNKPAGPSTYSQHGNGGGRSNIRTCLPFVLTPPRSIEESDGSDIDPQLDCLRRPQPCHRLDAATSGLLVASKTAGASIGMERIFRERLIEKTYVALVIGSPAESHGVIDSPLIVKVPKGSEKKKADFGKGLPSRDKVVVSAVTEYTVTGSFPSLKGGTISRLTLKPKTGRTHQLRRHCADVLGCPIVGDDKYDFASPSAMALRGRGLFLCATEQKFCHPITGEPLHIRIDEPPKFQSLLDHEAARWRKFQHDPCTDDDVSAPAVAQQLRQDDDDDDDDLAPQSESDSDDDDIRGGGQYGSS